MAVTSLKTTLFNVDLIFDKAKIKQGEQVGDLGCGRNGQFVFLSAKLTGKKGTVWAVDVIKSNLQILEKEAKEQGLSNIKTVWSDIETFGATKITPASLDLVFLINVLHEAKSPFNILKEVSRLTKTNGRIIIVDWKKSSSPLGPSKEARLDKDFIIQGVNKIGLAFEDEFEAGPYHFGLILNKI